MRCQKKQRTCKDKKPEQSYTVPVFYLLSFVCKLVACLRKARFLSYGKILDNFAKYTLRCSRRGSFCRQKLPRLLLRNSLYLSFSLRGTAAMASISTLPPRGSSLTATVERAGGASLKRLP